MRTYVRQSPGLRNASDVLYWAQEVRMRYRLGLGGVLILIIATSCTAARTIPPASSGAAVSHAGSGDRAQRALQRTRRRTRYLRCIDRYLVRFQAVVRQSVAAQKRDQTRAFSGRLGIRRLPLGRRRFPLQQHGLHYTGSDVRSLDGRPFGSVGYRRRDHAELRKQSRLRRRWRAERSRRLGGGGQEPRAIAPSIGRSETKCTARGSTICTRSRTIR